MSADHRCQTVTTTGRYRVTHNQLEVALLRLGIEAKTTEKEAAA